MVNDYAILLCFTDVQRIISMQAKARCFVLIANRFIYVPIYIFFFPSYFDWIWSIHGIQLFLLSSVYFILGPIHSHNFSAGFW